MTRRLDFLAFLAAVALAACPGPEPTGGPDAQALRPDAEEQVDAAQQPPPDAGPLPSIDAATPDGSVSAPSDASSAGADASSAGADASSAGADAGASGSPAEARVGSEDDALSSYLINASPAAWNIFSGASVPLGRHFDADHVSYHTALRFPSVSVPQGATVTSARLTFYPTNEVDSSNNLYLNVYAEKVADSAPFDPSNYDTGRPDQRLKTTANIDHWVVRCNDSCTDLTEYDCPQRKLDCWDRTVAFTCPKDLKALVQEVVSQPGWAAGNALTIFLINSATDQDGAKYQSSRSIVGYDTTLGVDHAPKLVVEFTK